MLLPEGFKVVELLLTTN